MHRVLSALVLFLLAASPTAPPSVAEAARLFQQYVARERAFDPAVADLYADSALIRNRRTYPTGQVKELTLPAPKYKDLIRSSMSLAKARGDVSTYSDVKYTPEGRGVRITATRFSELKRYSSPLSLLVMPQANNVWLIVEELSESQP